jgi:hypothetical protein
MIVRHCAESENVHVKAIAIDLLQKDREQRLCATHSKAVDHGENSDSPRHSMCILIDHGYGEGSGADSERKVIARHNSIESPASRRGQTLWYRLVDLNPSGSSSRDSGLRTGGNRCVPYVGYGLYVATERQEAKTRRLKSRVNCNQGDQRENDDHDAASSNP